MRTVHGHAGARGPVVRRAHPGVTSILSAENHLFSVGHGERLGQSRGRAGQPRLSIVDPICRPVAVESLILALCTGRPACSPSRLDVSRAGRQRPQRPVADWGTVPPVPGTALSDAMKERGLRSS